MINAEPIINVKTMINIKTTSKTEPTIKKGLNRKRFHTHNPHKSESGFVLIVGLVFILIIAVITVSSMQSSNLDYKISTNSVLKDVAFQSSESGRLAAGEAISHFSFYDSWTGYSEGGFEASALKTYDPVSDVLSKISVNGVEQLENPLDTNQLNVDLSYEKSGANIETIKSDINIIKAPAVLNNGAGLQQLAGYDGLGKGLGNGGTTIIFEIRSASTAGAFAVTATEYKVIP